MLCGFPEFGHNKKHVYLYLRKSNSKPKISAIAWAFPEMPGVSANA